MPSEFAPPGGKPKVTKKQVQEMQENYQKAGELARDTSAEEAEEKAILDELFDAEFDEVFTEGQKVGVYIGRFQPFHKGHENVLQQAIEENDKVLVFIGIGGSPEINPFSHKQCVSFFNGYESADLDIELISDTADDREWVASLSQMIDAHTIANSELTIYGGDLQDDYAIKAIEQYIGEYIEVGISYTEVSREKFLIPIDGEDIELSASLCREAMNRGDQNFLEQALPESVYHILKKEL